VASGPAARGPIAFAEAVLQLLDRGGFVATYKYAVFLGLMDLCLEGTTKSGEPPATVTTRQLAGKVLELYWPQTRSFQSRQVTSAVLRQKTGSQAKMISDILEFKKGLQVPESSVHAARLERPEAYAALVDSIEWTLILMPLPRLQNLGGRSHPILYTIDWDEGIERRKRSVVDYQQMRSSDFNNMIYLLPEVGRYLVQLNGVLRPLIYREWTSMVARINKLEISDLECFLFGTERAATARLRREMVSLQGSRCFYCDDRLKSDVEVDHFIPWSRYPDNGLDNLVAAHSRCNRLKRDFLAAACHVGRWLERMAPGNALDACLNALAQAQRWERHPERTAGVARGIYLGLPAGTMLWSRDNDFEAARPPELASLFAGS
jgi:5-methylcytosine-specific restriction endonuclease McrA